ncbi:uncharacterized protein JN550_001242 [Neoarthrinium moseri]|uniref:uncharacterized protein n=1 Tax=Neoarthrinium moseri TaxID=1658444 RepID=UPI001FDADA6C|nr:uncharacterized protein JN550_001242 [Neoarthrinium moseri]KAI1877170.1 hypothetical protein JN550_001242 [Neoarthrinium moseri]
MASPHSETGMDSSAPIRDSPRGPLDYVRDVARPSEEAAETEESDEKPHVSKFEREEADLMARPNNGPGVTDDEIRRTESRNSVASRRSKVSQTISKVLSKPSKESKKDHLQPTILPLSELEKGIVGWDSQHDPTMPLNFSRRRKMTAVVLLALITLMAPLSSSILSPAIKYYTAEFGETNATVAAMPVSIFLLGFAVGPLFLAPMSEIFGRKIVLILANSFFCCMEIGCALPPNLGSLVAFRFLAGVGGSVNLTIGGGIIADLFPIEERGFAMSIWTIGPTIGPSVAPLVGAFIAGSIGWRWAAWICFIPSTLVTGLLVFVFPETNHRVLIKHKTSKLRKELGRPELESCYETPESRSLSNAAILRLGLLRPLKLLFLSPIIFTISLYISFVYGTLYLMYNSVPTVFQTIYGWSTGVSGLAFIAMGCGYTAGLIFFSYFSDRSVIRLTAANGGIYEPEMRLPTMAYFAMITPCTFFWYGWAAEKHAHWAAAVTGIFPLGLGIFGLWMPAQAYIIDAYPQYAASGIAAFTVLRSLTGAFLPLAGPALFANLGIGWGNSVLGFLCIAMIPVPIIIHRFGRKIRKKWPVKL